MKTKIVVAVCSFLLGALAAVLLFDPGLFGEFGAKVVGSFNTNHLRKNGSWSHDCLFEYNLYDWESTIVLHGKQLIVKTAFDFTSYKSPDYFAFEIYPEGYEYYEIFISQDGEIITIFEDNKWAHEYGGLEKFQKDLDNLGINWVSEFDRLWEIWEVMDAKDTCDPNNNPNPIEPPESIEA